MRQHDDSRQAVEKTVRDLTRKTRRHVGAEEKIRIVLQGLRGEESMAEICRREVNRRVSFTEGPFLSWCCKANMEP